MSYREQMKTSFLAKRHYSQSLYQDTSCSCESPRSVFHALNLCACSPILIYIFSKFVHSPCETLPCNTSPCKISLCKISPCRTSPCETLQNWNLRLGRACCWLCEHANEIFEHCSNVSFHIHLIFLHETRKHPICKMRNACALLSCSVFVVQLIHLNCWKSS